MLPSLKYRRQMENISVAQKYQKELWHWAFSLQKAKLVQSCLEQ